MIGIYRITNTVSGKVYIGSSTDLAKRKSSHFAELQRGVHGNRHLLHASQKYGVSVLRWDILEHTTKDELLVREQYWMDTYQSYDHQHGYNINPTASGTIIAEETLTKHSLTNKRLGIRPPSQLGVKQSAETRLRRSLSLKRVGHRPPSNKGKPHSEETKQKIRLALMGNKNPCKNRK